MLWIFPVFGRQQSYMSSINHTNECRRSHCTRITVRKRKNQVAAEHLFGCVHEARSLWMAWHGITCTPTTIVISNFCAFDAATTTKMKNTAEERTNESNKQLAQFSYGKSALALFDLIPSARFHVFFPSERCRLMMQSSSFIHSHTHTEHTARPSRRKNNELQLQVKCLNGSFAFTAIPPLV